MKKILILLLLSSSLAHSVSAQESQEKKVEATEKTEDMKSSGSAENSQNTESTETSDSEPNDRAEALTPSVARSVKSISNWGVSLAVLQWNETLKLQQNVTTVRDVANFNAMTLTVQKEKTYYRWGWNMNGFIGSGRVVGGGNTSLIAYQKDKVSFTLFGISPRIFYRLSGRINAGLTAMVFMKNIDWPKDSASQTVDSGRKLNITAIADLNIRLFQRWDFYSGIGPIDGTGTLWKVGMNYRF